MNPAVDIAVPPAISLSNGIYHRLRLLARSSVVEVHQRTPVYRLVQYRKIGSVHSVVSQDLCTVVFGIYFLDDTH